MITKSAKFNPLFRSLDADGLGKLELGQVVTALRATGISLEDQRLAGFWDRLRAGALDSDVDPSVFDIAVGAGAALFERAIRRELVIPDFDRFAENVTTIFEQVLENHEGEIADYIPQLSRVEPDQFALSICTIDGQRLDLGNHDNSFTLQSSCKPMLYCAALEQQGTESVHSHIGREPSGRSFNELTLGTNNLPHNPMINAGAIMSSALVEPGRPMADRIDYLRSMLSSLSGGAEPGFDNATFHSERDTADRNFALAHYMREVGAFPEATDLHQTLDLYFSACSMLTDASSMATVADTYANGGVCPLTEARVFRDDTVKNCLSMMYSCGMYDYSGEFAFTVGIPAKSSVSGVILAVIPNVMGIAVWSPRLDTHGNSVRGVEFLKRLVARYNFHNYDTLVESSKLDPRHHRTGSHHNLRYSAIYAASTGDITELKRMVAHGHDLNTADYDGRTPLHLAAAEGQLISVRYLLAQQVEIRPADRWNNTPEQEALRHGHDRLAEVLCAAAEAESLVAGSGEENTGIKAA
jgi:glutaminase